MRKEPITEFLSLGNKNQNASSPDGQSGRKTQSGEASWYDELRAQVTHSDVSDVQPLRRTVGPEEEGTGHHGVRPERAHTHMHVRAQQAKALGATNGSLRKTVKRTEAAWTS